MLLMPTNLWEYAWKGLKARTMKTTSQEEAGIHWVTIILCPNLFPYLKSHENTRCEGSSGEWTGKMEKIPAWRLTKVRNVSGVIAEARNKGHTVHVASLMDLCHLKNSELVSQFRKYKGQVVLQGDIVKDDSGSYAVFTEQGSSTNDGSKSNGRDIKATRVRSKPQMPYLLIPRSKWRMHHLCWRYPKSECPDIWIRLPKHIWPKWWSSLEDPVVPLERNLYSHPLPVLLWERQFEKVLLKNGWEKVPKWECYLYTRKHFICVCGWHKNWLERNKTLVQHEILMKDVDLGEPTSFFDHVYLGCTQRECQTSKDIVHNYRSMFESRIPAGVMEKWPETKATVKPDAGTISSWSYDMEGHANKCVERNYEQAKKRRNNKTKSRRHAWMTINLKRRKLDQLEKCPQFAHKLLWNSYIWLVLADIQTCSCGHEMDKSTWQTFGTFDLLHSSHMWIQTLLSCGKHSTTMQIRIVSRLWFCRRPWRLEVNTRRKSNICSHKLDVQETNLSFTQFYGSWNHFSRWRFTHGRCRFTRGWDSRSRSLGFRDWSVSFLTKPNQQNHRCKRAMEKPVGKHSTKHAKTDSNHAHQSRSLITFHQAEHILVPMLCCVCLRTMKPR